MASADLDITARGLSKRFKIGRAGSARGVFSRSLQRILRQHHEDSAEELWALRDVTFDVPTGQVVGIIGRNGAGKSTLLKILSRITAPTEGEVRMRGRVASLLEVGTGFHPELTGRENIYMNGSILGMARGEIEERFDEIVSFSGVERFIDTPLKRYSSGMQVRLAFSVAAHLRSEVLIVDEVLAVGDAEFQRKCLGTLGGSKAEGRTTLFVSHSMPMVEALCKRVIWLEAGRIHRDGPAAEVISEYLAGSSHASYQAVDLREAPRVRGKSRAIVSAWAETPDGEVSSSVKAGSSLTIKFRYRLDEPLDAPGFGFGFEDASGRRVFSLNNHLLSNAMIDAPREGVCECRIPALPLLEGTYWLTLSLTERKQEWIDCIERALSIHVQPADIYGTGRVPTADQGIIFVQGTIEVSPHDRRRP